MKKMKLIITIILTLSIFTSISAKQYTVDSGTWEYYNTYAGYQTEQYFVKYDLEDNSVLLYFGKYYNWTFGISRDDIKPLKNIIKKYKDWNKKASANNITLNKEIVNMKLDDGFWWKSGNEWRVSYDYMTFKFFSFNTNTHVLVILGDMNSSSNKYIDTDLYITLSWVDVIKLEKVLSNLDVYKHKALKEKNKEALFN